LFSHFSLRNKLSAPENDSRLTTATAEIDHKIFGIIIRYIGGG